MGFGDELRDQLPDIDHYTQNGIVFLEDFRDFVKERIALENEYAAKLEGVVKTYQRKVRKSGYSQFGAGTTFREDKEKTSENDYDLSKSSSSAALANLLYQTGAAAALRKTFAERLVAVVSDPLKIEYKRKEEARLKHIAFSESLTASLALTKAESDKAKQAYRQACNQMEAAYLRYDKAANTAEQSEKLKKEWNDAMVVKNDRQNEYLLALQALSAHKKNNIYVDSATLMNNLQALNEHTILRAQEIFRDYINLDNQCMGDIRLCNDSAMGVVDQISGQADTSKFISDVKKAWQEAPDEEFSKFTDQDIAQLDHQTGQTLLLNTLLKLRQSVVKFDADIAVKVKEIEGTRTLLDSFAKGLNRGDSHDTQEKIIQFERERAQIQSLKVKAVAQIQLIESVLGEVETKEHTFKKDSKGNCVVCKSGLSMFNGGFVCQDCKATVHKNCASKLPPCGHHVVTTSATVQPSSRGHIVRSNTTKPNRNSMRKSDSYGKAYATVLYDFAKANEGELEAKVGDKIRVVDADDGNGWLTGEINGVIGVIPTNYVEMPKDLAAAMSLANNVSTPSSSTSTVSLSQAFTPPVASPPQKQGHFVRALYDYDAAVDLELSIREGDIIEVTNTDVGAGWWEGKLNGKVGQFPQNYVETA